jgi:hypothetical protein
MEPERPGKEHFLIEILYLLNEKRCIFAPRKHLDQINILHHFVMDFEFIVLKNPHPHPVIPVLKCRKPFSLFFL